MQLLIDIPDGDYAWIKDASEGVTSYPITLRLYWAVADGAPLAKVLADHCQCCKLRKENGLDDCD